MRQAVFACIQVLESRVRFGPRIGLVFVKMLESELHKIGTFLSVVAVLGR